LQDHIYLGLTTTEALFSRSQLKKDKADKDNQSSGKHLQCWQGGMYAEKNGSHAFERQMSGYDA
jgi:hypothetical protein